MFKLFKSWFQNKKTIETLTIENNELKEKNKKCQENINKTNAHYKSILKKKK